MGESDLQILQHILDTIWSALLSGSIPTKDLLNALDGELMEVGPDDPDAAIEVHPVVASVLSAVGICILGCRRNDVPLAEKAGETIINVLDYELDEQNPEYGTDSLRRMFEQPEMKHELETQLTMIEYLRGEYTLDDSLRSIGHRGDD